MAFPALLPFLVEDYINGASFVDRYGNDFFGIGTAEQWFELSKQLASVINRVHECQVVHGDLHPGNIMISNGANGTSERLMVIDFGQAYLADCSLSAPEPTQRNQLNFYNAPERRRGSNWDRTADIYSLGGILYYLASGRDPLSPETGSDRAGRIADEIARRNRNLMREAPSISNVIAKATADDPSRRYSTVAAMLQDLEFFQRSGKPVDELPKGSPGSVMLKQISHLTNPFLKAVCENTVNEAQRLIDSLSRSQPRFEITGDREAIVGSLLRYLAVLESGDEYWTITSPLFWSHRNLGYNGRFMAMNEVMASRGVKIRRVIFVSASDAESSLWESIVQSHLRVKGRLQDHFRGQGMSEQESLQSVEDVFLIHKKLVTPEEISSIHGLNHVVGLWIKDGIYTAVNFGMAPGGTDVRRVTFWSPETSIGEGIHAAMRKHLANATALS